MIILLDLNYTRDTTSGAEGLDLLARLRELDRNLPIVVMTAWGSVEGAVEAMRRGARDYVEKPWDNERLIATLRNQAELGRALFFSTEFLFEDLEFAFCLVEITGSELELLIEFLVLTTGSDRCIMGGAVLIQDRKVRAGME